MKASLFLLFAAGALVSFCDGATIRFANVYTNHMVLQRAPQKASVWGYVTGANTVTVRLFDLNGNFMQQKTAQLVPALGMWQAVLDPVSTKTSTLVQVVTDDGTSAILQDVLFGDVWICSGQSNMEMPLSQVFNGQQEINGGAAYNGKIRVLKVAQQHSSTENFELVRKATWLLPQYGLNPFSAICYMTGKRIQERTGYPVGLIDSSYGGSSIQAWMRPHAISKCGGTNTLTSVNHVNSNLWNAMMLPFAKMSIKGVLWYQGETNVGSDNYGCLFKEMITDWRTYFNWASGFATSNYFPFGFVQLAGYANTYGVGWGRLRWLQTAGQGYAPNPQIPNTFMAVAIDLPDQASPYHPIHPRFKEDIAKRLFRGALNVVYGDKSSVFQGPYPAIVSDSGKKTVSIVFYRAFQVRTNDNKGFQVCCVPASDTHTRTCNISDGRWKDAPILATAPSTVTVSTAGCGGRPAVVRYLWDAIPCSYLKCPLYGPEGLPVPPFVLPVNRT